MTEDSRSDTSTTREIRWPESKRAFMTRLLESTPDEISAFLQSRFKYDCFEPDAAPRLRWIIEQFGATGALPSLAILAAQFPGFADDSLVLLGDRVDYDRNKPTLLSAYREAQAMFSLRVISNGVNRIADRWNDPKSTIEDLREEIRSCNAAVIEFGSPEADESQTLAETATAVLADIDRAKAGETWGIPLPFPFFHHASMGAQPGDITVLVGRPSVGKTFAGCMCCISAITGNPYFFTPRDRAAAPPEMTPEALARLSPDWASRVMFYSYEMPTPVTRKRLFALLTRTPYPQIKSGRFLPGVEERFRAELARQTAPDQAASRCLLPDRINDIEQLFAKAEAFKARMVVVDGFYLMVGKKDEKRWETIQRMLALFRNHARNTGIHYVLISQLDTQSDRIMFAQAIEQDASNILFLLQSAQEKGNMQIRMFSKKVRDGQSAEEFLYSWDVTAGRFGQERPAPRAQNNRG